MAIECLHACFFDGACDRRLDRRNIHGSILSPSVEASIEELFPEISHNSNGRFLWLKGIEARTQPVRSRCPRRPAKVAEADQEAEEEDHCSSHFRLLPGQRRCSPSAMVR